MRSWKNLVFPQLLCMLSFLLFICVVSQANPISGPIIPGKSMGQLELGMTRQQVASVIGKTLTKQQSRRGYLVNIWMHYSANSGETSVITVYYRNDRAVYFELVSSIPSKFIIPGGITSGSPLSSAIAHYPDLKLSAYHIDIDQDDSIEKYYYDNIREGVVFIVTPDDYYNHSHPINMIGIHSPGVAMPEPFEGVPVKQTLNKPPRPKKIPTGPNSPFSKDGLPLTEHLTLEGLRGYTTKQILMPNGVGLIGIAGTSFRGKRMTPQVYLAFTLLSQGALWHGETYVTFIFAGRRLRLQGVKSTEPLGNGDYLETLKVKMPISEFLNITKFGNLNFEIGDVQYRIDKNYLAGLRALRAKVNR